MISDLYRRVQREGDRAVILRHLTTMAHCPLRFIPTRSIEAPMFLLDPFKKQGKDRTPYEWFEQVILGVLVFIIAIIIIYLLILSGQRFSLRN